MRKKLTHIDRSGKAKMVDVSKKVSTYRFAHGYGCVQLSSNLFKLIENNDLSKGDVLTVAKTAAILAAKRTSELIPLCHNIPLSSVDVEFLLNKEKSIIEINSYVKTHAPTGAEMEALVAVSVASLTIYDMCKSVDKNIVIGQIMLLKKSGGKSGDYERKEANE